VNSNSECQERTATMRTGALPALLWLACHLAALQPFVHCSSLELLDTIRETPLETAKAKLEQDYDLAASSRERSKKSLAKAADAKEKIQAAVAEGKKAAEAVALAQKQLQEKSKELKHKANAPVEKNVPPCLTKKGAAAQMSEDRVEIELHAQEKAASHTIADADKDVRKKTQVLEDLQATQVAQSIRNQDENIERLSDQGDKAALEEVAQKQKQKKDTQERNQKQADQRVQAEKMEQDAVKKKEVEVSHAMVLQKKNIAAMRIYHMSLQKQKADLDHKEAALHVEEMKNRVNEAHAKVHITHVAKALKAKSMVMRKSLHNPPPVHPATTDTSGIEQRLTTKMSSLAKAKKQLDQKEKQITDSAVHELHAKSMLRGMVKTAKVQQAKAASLIKAQHRGFVALKTYKQREVTIKKLHAKRRAATSQLKELVQKKAAKAEYEKKTSVVKTAQKFDDFLLNEKAKQVAKTMKKKVEEQDKKEAVELSQKTRPGLLRVLKAGGSGSGHSPTLSVAEFFN